MNKTMTLIQLREIILNELTQNILPFHINHMIDEENGGFYGRITNDLVVDKTAVKGSVQCARILWTYSRAYKLFKNISYRTMADHAYAFLTNQLWDTQNGGLYWTVCSDGTPADRQKMTYAQAFGVYGLSEYFAATGNQTALQQALDLYKLIEQKMRLENGYGEGTEANWAPANVAIDEVKTAVSMSMNTHLHILEAYSNLYLVWPNEALNNQLQTLIQLSVERIYNSETGHLQLHFDKEWRSLNDHFSYGHDIEASWLIWEAAEFLKDKAICQAVRPAVLKLVDVTIAEGFAPDYGLYEAGDPSGIVNFEKHWWPQAEAMVGLINAYQMTGESRYVALLFPVWHFIQTKLVDHQFGGWLWGIDGADQPMAKDKAGLWKTPYHNGRFCFELLQRIDQMTAC